LEVTRMDDMRVYVAAHLAFIAAVIVIAAIVLNV
jgi:hypothetical protein